MSDRTEPQLWHRAGSIIGPIALMATPAYFWFDGLSQYATGRPLHQTAVSAYDFLHEAALHTSDTVSLGHLAIFALSLIVARSLYAAIDPEQRRRDKERVSYCVTRGIQRARFAYELLVMPAPHDNKVGAAHSEQLLVTHVRNRIGGI